LVAKINRSLLIKRKSMKLQVQMFIERVSNKNLPRSFFNSSHSLETLCLIGIDCMYCAGHNWLSFLYITCCCGVFTWFSIVLCRGTHALCFQFLWISCTFAIKIIYNKANFLFNL
jgi:hypothetical protein